MSKRIGVLGSGQVAQTLAAGLRKKGHDVMIGSRSPAKLAEWIATQEGIRAGTFAEVAAHGEIVILAVLGRAAEEALQLAGVENTAGKPVIDTTNPIGEEAPQNGVLRYFTHANESLMERLQAANPKAHLVKAFNSVGAGFMVDPKFPGGTPTMFICGNDADAKRTVSTLVVELGWAPEDFGLVESARPIEALCQLWCVPGMLKNEWTHAFKLLKM
jgi:predicted dinucleotide-binding enzyme